MNQEVIKWESIEPLTNQSYKVDRKEFNLGDNPANAIVQTKKLSAFFHHYGKFPSSYFIREEEKQVWKIMLDRLKMEDTVIVGSPGVGKSIFLMMFSFHVALSLGQSVLILRNLKATGWVYLYIEKSGFNRGKTDNLDFRNIRRYFKYQWMFLDGFSDTAVNNTYSSILRPFRVLATSCQYDNKDDDPAELVVLPAWRLEDMQAYAEQTNWAKDVKMRKRIHAKMIPMLVKFQYFYSGGNMRQFCRENEACVQRCTDLVRRISSDQKCLLLSGFGQQYSQQVDQIRRHFIEDIRNPDHYKRSWFWKTSVDSGWVMRWLQINRNVEQVYEFYQYAKAVSSGFYDSAFECLFHQTVRQYHKTHTIVLMTSDKSEYSKVELDISNISCSGNKLSECHERLQSLPEDTYWYPDYSHLPFIDCVCPCRLVNKSGLEEEKLGYIQVTIATEKVFRTHRMMELEKIKQRNLSFRNCDTIYVVVTSSKDTCDSFKFVEEKELKVNDYNLSDFYDFCEDDDNSFALPVNDDESIATKKNWKEDDNSFALPVNDDALGDQTRWKQVITYLNPDSVYRYNDGAHLLNKRINA